MREMGALVELQSIRLELLLYPWVMVLFLNACPFGQSKTRHGDCYTVNFAALYNFVWL